MAAVLRLTDCEWGQGLSEERDPMRAEARALGELLWQGGHRIEREHVRIHVNDIGHECLRMNQVYKQCIAVHTQLYVDGTYVVHYAQLQLRYNCTQQGALPRCEK